MLNLDTIISNIDLNNYVNIAIDYSISYLPKIIWSLIILYIWFKIVKYIERLIEKILQKQRITPMLRWFILSLINISLKIFVIIIAAWVLWVQTSSFVAMLAAAGFAIGMALSGTLQNIAGWIMILLLKPFKIWDFIEVSWHSWTVRKTNIFNTELNTPDKKKIIIPNGDIANGSLVNYSSEIKRRVDLVIWVSYSDNIDKVKGILRDIAESDERILNDKDNDITIWLIELADNSVNFAFRFYVWKWDYWPTKFDVLEKIKKTFDKEKVNFPFPQRDVHIYNEK